MTFQQERNHLNNYLNISIYVFPEHHCKNVERCLNVEYDIEHPMGIQLYICQYNTCI